MKTLAKREDLEEIRGLIGQLTEASARLWGAMSCDQMVCHLADSFGCPLRERQVARLKGPPIPVSVYKWLALWVPMKWPKGVGTPPEIDQRIGGTRPVEFAVDREALLRKLDQFVAGEGPVVHTPVRTLEHVKALRTDRVEELQYVARAIEKVATHFAAPRTDGDTLGIIGFCGAPWTLAGYMIEGGKQGGGDRNYIQTKKMMYSDGPAWSLLMEKIVTVLVAYAQQQVEAGADVIQVFDSWVGKLSVRDYRQYCLGWTTELVQRIKALGVPVIYFGVETASLLPAMSETGADVIGLDWRTPLEVGWKAVGAGCAVQGNLDPIALFAQEDVLKEQVREILDAAAGRPGHIFNLGHGIVPGTPVESVVRVVEWVRELSAR